MSENENIKKLINNVLNPITHKSLLEEGRIIEIAATDNAVTLKYLREGIPLEQKKQLDRELLQKLAVRYQPEVIKILAYSQEALEVANKSDAHQCGCAGSGHQAPPVEPPAQLAVGHGKMGDPRRVSGVNKVIAVASGKGGVGKSTFSVNLAVTMALQGKRVGLLDGDIYGPSLPMLMGQRGQRPTATSENRINPLVAHGVSFISFGSFIEEDGPVIWRGPMLGGVLNQFLFDVEWGSLDYLIIDMPPGTGDVQLSLIQNTFIDGAIIISTPQDVALLDATKALMMFTKLNVPVIGLVENMSSFVCAHGEEYFIFGKGGVQSAAQRLSQTYLGAIPIEVDLRAGADSGVPYMGNQLHEGKKAYQAYREIGHQVSRLLE